MTSYTNLSALLASLKSERFSGTVEIEWTEDKGILLIDTGEVVNAEAKVGGDSKRMIGSEAIQYLLALSNQKDGVLNIYQLLPEQVAIVASNLHYEVLFKELSTDFARFDRLLLKLREEKHNGFIEVFTKDRQARGVLFLQEGEPTELFTTSESGPSVFGRKSIPAFLESSVKEGAIFNVYRTLGRIPKEEKKVPEEEKIRKKGGKVATGEDEDVRELIPIFQEAFSRVEKSVDEIFEQKGKFLETFKKSLLQKLDEYPFLDPFSGEFEYREGTIKFAGDAAGRDWAKGIIQCLYVTLVQLQKELPKNKTLSLRLKAEIDSSLKPHRETLKRLGVDADLSSFYQ